MCATCAWSTASRAASCRSWTASASACAAARRSVWPASRAAARPRRRSRCSDCCRAASDARAVRSRSTPRRGVMLLHRRTPTGWRDVRWKTASMVFQGAMNALDPVMRIDRQIAEAIRLHEPGANADARVAELLERVGIPSAQAPAVPARVLRRHAPARDDRARAGLRARADDRRRADDRARRDDPGADPAAARRAAPRPRARAAADHARPLGDRRDLRSRRDHVCGPDRRAGAGARRPRLAPASVHGRLLAGFSHVGGPRTLGEAIPGSPPHPGEDFPGCRFAPRCHLAFADCVKAPIPLFKGSDGREARCLLAKLP